MTRSGRRSSVHLLAAVVALSITARSAAAQTLPDGWTASDVGGAAIRGSASYSDPAFTVSGAGADIWGTRDQFMFVHRQITGDATIVARVAALEHIDSWAKAGVMMRESLSYEARHAFALISGARGAAFQRRVNSGGPTTSSSKAGTVPRWIRLERLGNLFTASQSADGVSWATIASETIVMSSTITVGLAVTSHNVVAPARATFTDVSIETPTATTLPSGWRSSDIGVGVAPGSASHSNGLFTIDAAGRDVWDVADQFRYTYRQVSGDVDIVAHVASLDDLSSWTKAGLMIRRSLTASSAHASLFVSSGRGIAFQRRPVDAATTVHSAVAAGRAPQWVKLSRRGATVTALHSTDGLNWTESGTQVLDLGTSFYVGLAVSSHHASLLARATFSSVVVSAVAGALPEGWRSSDVGSGSVAGSSTYASGVFTVAGAGADIWGTRDRFRFAYQEVSGDVDVVARVASVEFVDVWTKAGLMVRGSLDANAAHASMFVSAGKGIAFQRRPVAGGLSVHTTAGSGTAPTWVKLSRRGLIVASYHSLDGAAWTLTGTETLSLGELFYVGLAVTSHRSSVAALASFDGVTIEPR